MPAARQRSCWKAAAPAPTPTASPCRRATARCAGLQIQGFVNGSSGTTGAGIVIDGSTGGGDNNTISDNVLTNNNESATGSVGAIVITGAADNNLITANRLINNNSDGIRFADASSTGNQITNNLISGSGDDGVKLSGANITFTGNTVSGTQRLTGGAAAVEVASVTGSSLIANNTITNDGAHGSEGGIWILGSSGVTVSRQHRIGHERLGHRGRRRLQRHHADAEQPSPTTVAWASTCCPPARPIRPTA